MRFMYVVEIFCSIGFDILYNHLTLPVFTIIEQRTRRNGNVFFFRLKHSRQAVLHSRCLIEHSFLSIISLIFVTCHYVF